MLSIELDLDRLNSDSSVISVCRHLGRFLEGDLPSQTLYVRLFYTSATARLELEKLRDTEPSNPLGSRAIQSPVLGSFLGTNEFLVCNRV